MKKRAFLTLFLTFCTFFQTNAQHSKIKIWPNLAPGTENRENTERWEADSSEVYEVYQPDLTLYLTENADRPAPAVIVCAGGGFRKIVLEKEGYKIARWFNKNNISAFVLKYRLNPAEALEDIKQAMSMIRSKSEEFHIDKNKIGVIGFSAGAHLAGDFAMNYETPDLRPDFWIGVYGHYEKRDSNQSYTNLVNQNSPPAMFIHAGDDYRVPASNSVNLYSAYLKHRVPAELHIYEKGDHGFALETNRGAAIASTANSWSARCIEWLKVRGIIE